MLQLCFVGAEKPPVWLVQTKYTIGSDADCEIVINHDSIMAQHAELLVVEEQLSILPVTEDGVVRVDGQVTDQQTPLFHGSSVQLGEVLLAVVDPKKQNAEKPPKAPEPLAHHWFLRGKTTALANKQFALSGSVTVGRAKECAISLVVAHLSRQHARLTPVKEGVQVKDLDSSNGTFINGQKITQAVARLGDEIRFDTLCFRLCHTSEQDGDDIDKTSLRPVLTEAVLQAHLADSRQTAGDAEVACPNKPPQRRLPVQPTQSQVSNSPREGSGLQLILGMGLSLLLTVGVLVYFMS